MCILFKVPNSILELNEKVKKQFPILNILINNAGEMRKINLNESSTDINNISGEIDINLLGPIRMILQFLPHLKSQKSSSILNVTSGLVLIPFPIVPLMIICKTSTLILKQHKWAQ